MIFSFRWFGPDDAVTLRRIRQIPGVGGIVTSLHHLPAGELWSTDEVDRCVEEVVAAGFQLSAIESLPVHEEIRLGGPDRDRLIDIYIESLRAVGEARIPVVCYNFMPIFDWTRSRIDFPLEDGSTVLSFDFAELPPVDPTKDPSLDVSLVPPWFWTARGEELERQLAAYRGVDEERLWDNLWYFLTRVIPVAEEVGVRMAIHPDDPPWSVFGLPRILTNAAAFQRLIRLVDSPANGVTFCTGSLGAAPSNDLPAMIRSLEGRIHFAHCRNVRVTGEKQFHEAAHPSAFGNVNMYEVMKAFQEIGFEGPLRPDHGRMIWGEEGRPGYGLHDRALGVMYLQGLWEAIRGGN
jgi:mannonate dehydratase